MPDSACTIQDAIQVHSGGNIPVHGQGGGGIHLDESCKVTILLNCVRTASAKLDHPWGIAFQLAGKGNHAGLLEFQIAQDVDQARTGDGPGGSDHQRCSSENLGFPGVGVGTAQQHIATVHGKSAIPGDDRLQVIRCGWPIGPIDRQPAIVAQHD